MLPNKLTNIQTSRLILNTFESSGITPTIFVNTGSTSGLSIYDASTVGALTSTDLLPSELVINSQDKRIWANMNDTIVELATASYTDSIIVNSLTATTISATTYYNLPSYSRATFILTSGASDIATYKQAVSLNNYSQGPLATYTTNISTSPTLLGVFATNLLYPNITVIPSGDVNIHYDVEKTSGGQYYYTYAEIYKRSSGGTETLLVTSDVSPQSAVNSILNIAVTALIPNNITVLNSDRIVLKIYGVMLSSTADVTLRIDDSTNSRFELPYASATNVDIYTTGGTLNADTLSFTKNDNNSYSVNLSPIIKWTAGTGSNSIVQRNSDSLSEGILSIAEGYRTTASGAYSHAEGYLTRASGNYSHAEGSGSTASGIASHAEGDSARAVGSRSHAEGYSSIASGSTSHAEGQRTSAFGTSSHAEGNLTFALGAYSHAEGGNTSALGYTSHAEGQSTIALGVFSHAEGYQTSAYGDYSHAEGANTIASGAYSHTQGFYSIAEGDNSHAEGYYNSALGLSSHAEGEVTTSEGRASHAEGSYTTASGWYSHAEGYQNITLGDNSHVGGVSSTASGVNSFVHSSGSTVNGDDSVILGGSGNIINAGVTGSTILGGSNITGTTSNYTYVPSLNIKTVGAGPGTSIAVDGSGNVVYTASDRRLKENIKDIESALEKVLALKGVTFNWKDRNKGGDITEIGFIAQEVQEVVPELIFNVPNSDLLAVKYDNTVALLVEAIKELSQAEFQIPLSTNLPASSKDEIGQLNDIKRSDDYLYIKTNKGWVRTELKQF